MKKMVIFSVFLLIPHLISAAQSKLLGLAAQGDGAEIIAFLIQNPLTNPTITVPPHLDHAGNNALHFLAQHPSEENRLEAIQALRKAGASATVPNKEGNTPIELAKIQNNQDLLDALQQPLN